MIPPSQLRPEVLGQLLLMQSVMGSLPSEESIFSFVSKGLLDMPGVRSVEIVRSDTTWNSHTAYSFPVQVESGPTQQLVFNLSDSAAFRPYREYLKNFCFMLSILLEERNQRRINQSHQRNLEKRVAERTRALEHEVQERKKAEEALHQSEKLFRATFEYAAIGKCLVDPDGTLLRVNNAFTEILGRPADELIGQNVMSVTHPKDREKSKEQIKKTLIGEQDSFTFEKRYIHSSGRTVWANTGSFFLRDEDGEPQFFITHVSDITTEKEAEEERLQLEEQLRHAHKMEAIGTLAGGIAHDFNNILAAIIGYTELATEDIPNTNPARDSLDQVQKAAQRAKDLVKQILTFSRKQAKNLAPLNIAETVQETLTFIRATIPTFIDIKSRIAQDCGVILADSGQINQIVMNLCSNSAQAMEENGGTLSLTLENSVLSRQQVDGDEQLKPGNYVVLEVCDTGEGIPEENLERIYDPYYTTKDVGKGSGMGLSVVLGLVKSHDGVIRVDSKVGQGTTFRVYFPRINDQVDVKPVIERELPTGSEHILVVDDEPAIIDILTLSMKKLGYSVTATTSSKEAIELFRAQPESFDLVISDQTMPNITGEKLCRMLQEIRPDVPIIMCTGYSSKMDQERAQDLGISRFILKPVSRWELALSLREALDSSF